VELAIAHTREEEQAHATAERERLATEHAAELERVRREAAGEAMQRLTDLLLGLDFGAPLHGATAFHRPRPASPPATPAAAASATGPTPVAEQPEEEEAGFDEPWIDTMLCTSCNDCLKINPLLFSYNEEKQASLGDTSKGTYAQLVEAAELCPARCIHPGKPWNPEEPNLEELMRRAAPFNQ
jgi:ferredoxin